MVDGAVMGYARSKKGAWDVVWNDGRRLKMSCCDRDVDQRFIYSPSSSMLRKNEDTLAQSEILAALLACSIFLRQLQRLYHLLKDLRQLLGFRHEGCLII